MGICFWVEKVKPLFFCLLVTYFRYWFPNNKLIAHLFTTGWHQCFLLYTLKYALNPIVVVTIFSKKILSFLGNRHCADTDGCWWTHFRMSFNAMSWLKQLYKTLDNSILSLTLDITTSNEGCINVSTCLFYKTITLIP